MDGRAVAHPHDDGGGIEIRAVQPTYLYHELARELERYISVRDLQPGDELPSERDLCEQLSASRPSVREALRILELVGLVRTRRGGRPIVGNFDLRFLTDWLGRSLPRSDQGMRELLTVRETLEVKAAELAATCITKEHQDEMEKILKRTELKVERGENAHDEDIAFHEVVFAACGNSVLLRLVDVISGLLRDLRRQLLADAGSATVMLQDHRWIRDALLTGNPDLSGAAMRHHIRAVSRLADGLIHEREARRAGQHTTSS